MTTPREPAADPSTNPEAPSSGTTIEAPIDEVWAAIADPRTYPLWLVGAQRIRAVDEEWPAVGSSFHHTVGWAPLRLRDHTDVVALERPRRLVLRAHISSLGAANVTMQLRSLGRTTTEIHIDEEPHEGVVRAMWRFGGRTLLRLGLWGRNTESLRRLKEGVEDAVIVGQSS